MTIKFWAGASSTSLAMIMEAREEDAHPLPELEKVAVSKPAKNRRKISMPWFRQSSFGMTIARLRLPRQHTIAAPDPVVEINADEVSLPRKGASIYYVRKIFGILDPLPPFVRISRNLSVSDVRIFRQFLNPPSPR